MALILVQFTSWKAVIFMDAQYIFAFEYFACSGSQLNVFGEHFSPFSIFLVDKMNHLWTAVAVWLNVGSRWFWKQLTEIYTLCFHVFIYSFPTHIKKRISFCPPWHVCPLHNTCFLFKIITVCTEKSLFPKEQPSPPHLCFHFNTNWCKNNNLASVSAHLTNKN